MRYRCAAGDLIQPAHNKSSQRSIPGHAQTAVPLGCGQLGSGADSGDASRPARLRLPPARLSDQRFRCRSSTVIGIERPAFRHHCPGQVQQHPDLAVDQERGMGSQANFRFKYGWPSIKYGWTSIKYGWTSIFEPKMARDRH